MSDESSAPPAPPQPTAEHKALAEHVGNWDVACTFYMDPSQPPMKIDGCEKVEALGPFWVVSDFEASMFEQPFHGKCSMGYDTHRKEYVFTWMDSMSPTLFELRGNYDDACKVLEMTGTVSDCMMNTDVKYRTREERVSADKRIFEMFMAMPGGGEHKMFTHVYTRAK